MTQKETQEQKRVEIFGFEHLSFSAQVLLFEWFRQVRKEEPNFDVLLAGAYLSPDSNLDNKILLSVAEGIGTSLSADKQLLEIVREEAQYELAELGQ